MSHCGVGGSCRECEEAENNKIKTEKEKKWRETQKSIKLMPNMQAVLQIDARPNFPGCFTAAGGMKTRKCFFPSVARLLKYQRF